LFGLGITHDDDIVGGGDSTPDNEDQYEVALSAISGGTVTIGDDNLQVANITFVADPCNGAKADNPVWAVTDEMTYSASSTLANGLFVEVSGDIAPAGPAIKLGGSFGTVTFKDGVDSAVKASYVGHDADIAVAGGTISAGHRLGTEGTAGVGLLWQAPSVAGADLFISYSPNSTNTGLNNAEYHDTIGFGISFAAEMLSLSVGVENADNKTDSCHTGTVTLDLDGTPATVAASTLFDEIYGFTKCGDESNMVVGASMSAGDIGIKAGYSSLDSEEADQTTTNVHVNTSVGDWAVNAGWVSSELQSRVGAKKIKQTILGGGISTNLGDGVTLGLSVSNNEYDDPSQTLGNGKTSDFRSQVKIEASF